MVKYISLLLCALFIGPCYGQFLGGAADGYNIARYTNSITIFSGGSKDGHGIARYNNAVNIFSGGLADGYNKSIYNNPISIFSGGNDDGYNRGERAIEFIWTGSVGVGWNVIGNWSDGRIPNLNSKVIIPSGVPNFPKINAGLLTINDDPSGLGNFFCKEITILQNAEMTLRINAVMENYGSIDIRGSFFILNSNLNAVKNVGEGLIIIRSNGVMEFVGP